MGALETVGGPHYPTAVSAEIETCHTDGRSRQNESCMVERGGSRFTRA